MTLLGHISKELMSDYTAIASKYFKANKISDPALCSFLKKHINSIIAGKPDFIVRIANNAVFQKCIEKNLNELNKAFKYDSLRDNIKAAAILTRDIKVCPYCNRNFIFSYEATSRSTKHLATFDHFYPQSKFPHLSLSFYNLIPSCSACNQKLKRDEEGMIYPYMGDFDERAKFEIKLHDIQLKDEKSIGLEIQPVDDKDKEAHRSIEVFKLNETYKKHTNHALELIKRKRLFTSTYAASVSKITGKAYDADELSRIMYGTSGDKKDLLKYPLSKLAKDVLDIID